MQNINIKDEHGTQLLQSEPELDQDTHLMMCRRLYLGQVRRGNHARIEHPERCKAWSIYICVQDLAWVSRSLEISAHMVQPPRTTMALTPSSESPLRCTPPSVLWQ